MGHIIPQELEIVNLLGMFSDRKQAKKCIYAVDLVFRMKLMMLILKDDH